MFVRAVYYPKLYKCWFLRHLPKNCEMPLGELKTNIREERFKTSENCFQIQTHRSRRFLTSILIVAFPQLSSYFSLTPLSASLSTVFMVCLMAVSTWRANLQGHLLSVHSCYLYVHSLCTICNQVHHPPHATIWQPVCQRGQRRLHMPFNITQRWRVNLVYGHFFWIRLFFTYWSENTTT